MLKEKIKRRFKRLLIAGLVLVCLSGAFSSVAAGIENAINSNEQVAGQSIEVEQSDYSLVRTAYAQAADKKSDVQKEIIEKLVAVISYLLAALNRIFWPIILFMGGLMDNSLLFGGGMEEKALSIWRNIRDLVNIVFVVILLAIALMNVIGVGGENYQLKTILPKFIIGLIAVNFSFLAMKVVLDATTVATAAMFSLPAQMNVTPAKADDTEQNEKLMRGMCKGICGTDLSACESYDTKKDPKLAPMCYTKKKGEKCFEVSIAGKPAQELDDKIWGDELCASQKIADTFTHFNGNNASVVLAVRMMNMADLDSITDVVKKLSNPANIWSGLTVGLIFSLIMYIVYGTGFVVLFILLITRLVVLWLALILSPIIVLKYVVPQVFEKLSGSIDIEKQFVQAAIAPIIIGFTMSVGFIMMDQFQGLPDSKMTGAELLGQGLATPGISTIHELIMAAATIAFVWAGITGATKDSIASALTDKITGAVAGAGSWLAFAPFKYTGFIPVGKREPGKSQEKISGQDALDALKALPQHFEDKRREKLKGLIPWMGTSGEDLSRGLRNGTKTADQVVVDLKNKPIDQLRTTFNELQNKAKRGELSDKKLQSAIIDASNSPDDKKLGEIQKLIDKSTTTTATPAGGEKPATDAPSTRKSDTLTVTAAVSDGLDPESDVGKLRTALIAAKDDDTAIENAFKNNPKGVEQAKKLKETSGVVGQAIDGDNAATLKSRFDVLIEAGAGEKEAQKQLVKEIGDTGKEPGLKFKKDAEKAGYIPTPKTSETPQE
ncbi:hypothetical protein KKG51_00415 [Patescibacteria group bacterium]|nr:hypothetical protein [Patescibacteria group bacterium]